MGTAPRRLREAGAACAAALQFLTRLPVPVRLHYDNALFRRSVIFYPLAGWLMGALTVAFGVLLADVLELPATVTAALTLAFWASLSGALHLDGLMDTADGVLSHRSRERMLEIMKDSRVGAMGVIVCVLLLLVKWTLLAELLPSSGSVGTSAWLLLPLVMLWSRWFMVVAIWGWPYARSGKAAGGGHVRVQDADHVQEGIEQAGDAAAAVAAGSGNHELSAAQSPESGQGQAEAGQAEVGQAAGESQVIGQDQVAIQGQITTQGHASGKDASDSGGGLGGFFREVGRRHVGAATVAAVLLSGAAIGLPGSLGWLTLTAGQALGLALLTIASTVLVGTAVAAYLNRKLGGLTGDTYGAINEVLEAVLLLVLMKLAAQW
ncbi:adenosylcobinamide-GDP ribazoletransferase [Paenibacillus filicis]|uniref:Adenosylcobinamide-GDP ribazoletransferase n=1 Tax=Paenibacillus filicis TaxID=669464 RepID=A0ABU9DDU4_9BACL